MTIRSLTLTTAAIIGLAVAPAHARLVKLTVAGHITSGSDGGNDLDNVTNGPGGYVEHFAPGSVFGTIGDLTGNAIRFSFIYDTNDVAQPLGVGGVFDDQAGQWAYDATKAVTIGAVTHDFLPLQPVFTFIALTATLGVTDGTPDGLSGNFTGFTGWGDVYSNFYTSGLSFDANAAVVVLRHRRGAARQPARPGFRPGGQRCQRHRQLLVRATDVLPDVLVQGCGGQFRADCDHLRCGAGARQLGADDRRFRPGRHDAAAPARGQDGHRLTGRRAVAWSPPPRANRIKPVASPVVRARSR